MAMNGEKWMEEEVAVAGGGIVAAIDRYKSSYPRAYKALFTAVGADLSVSFLSTLFRFSLEAGDDRADGDDGDDGADRDDGADGDDALRLAWTRKSWLRWLKSAEEASWRRWRRSRRGRRRT